MDFLVEQHAPVLYFHRDEQYFTSSIEYYLDNSDVKLNEEVILSSPGQRELYDFSKTNPDANLASIHPREYHIKNGDLQNTVSYVIIKHAETAIYITYIYFFPYNGAYNVLGCIKAGAHDADIEHFTIEINPNTLRPLRYYFSNHGYQEGGWYYPYEIEYENSKPVVYVAKYSHGLFYKPGVVIRIGGFANDVMNKGTKLEPQNYNRVIIEKEDSMFFDDSRSWIYYPGQWAPTGIRGVVGQAWYNHIESNERRPFYFTTTTATRVCAAITSCAALIFSGLVLWG